MNNGGIVGKFLYFWIFMIGVLLFAKYLGHVDDGRHMVYVCIAAALVYIVFMVFRALGRNKREEKAEKSVKQTAHRCIRVRPAKRKRSVSLKIL